MEKRKLLYKQLYPGKSDDLIAWHKKVLEQVDNYKIPSDK